MKTKILILIAALTSVLSSSLSVTIAEAQEIYRDSGLKMGYLSSDETVSTDGYDQCFTSVGNYLWVQSDNSANKEPFFQIRDINNRISITHNRYADGKGVYVCHNSAGQSRNIKAGYVASGTTIGAGLTCVVSVANFVKIRQGGGGSGTVACSYNRTTGVITASQTGAGRISECGYICAEPSTVTTANLFSLNSTQATGTRNIGAQRFCAAGINTFSSQCSSTGFYGASYNRTTGVAVLGYSGDGCVSGKFSYLCSGGVQCADGIDNDGDGLTDRNDPGCWTNPLDPASYDPNLNYEGARPSQCQDGLDNDSDGVTDASDPGCWRDVANSATYDRTLNNEARANPSQAQGTKWTELECQAVPNTGANTYNTNIQCVAKIARPGSGRWHNAFKQYCPTFCASIGAINVPSPDGFSCTSGEKRPWSAIKAGVDYSPTGCWHSCSQPEGIAGAKSESFRCYHPTQKRDNDRTDTTVGCFCATGDTGATTIEVGIHSVGVSKALGVSLNLAGWSRVDRKLVNDRENRLFDVLGEIPLGGTGTLSMNVNIQGACGTNAVIKGNIALPSGAQVPSENLVVPLPACVPQCQNGRDDDQDGLVDLADPGCSGPTDNNEGDGTSQCQNGKDDDQDGLIDLADPGCSCPTDNNESDGTSQCQNGKDDDKDGLIDLADPGCSGPTDNNESDGTSQCQNGKDDDKDGLIDLADPGCSNPQDNNEADGTAQCQNRRDDDKDGLIDLGDPGCSSSTDNNEADGTSECQDGKDNDNDGRIDMKDLGCSSPQDNRECGEVVPVSTSTPTPTSTATATPTATPTATATPTVTATPTATATSTFTQTATPTSTATSTATPASTDTPTVTSFKVTPVAECVDTLQNGNLLAHFGYTSDEASSVTIPVGVKNNVAPGVSDVGQPTTFFKGSFGNVFTVIIPVATPNSPSETTSNVIRWTLGDASVEASIQTQRCSGGDISCNETDNKETLAQLDNLASRQRNTVRSLANRIRSASRGSSLSDLADTYTNQAQSLYLEQWTAIWSSFPQVTKACTGCAAIDTTSNVTEITERSKKLLRLTKRAAATLKKARRRPLNASDTARVTVGTTLHDRTLEVSKQLPRFNSQCN